MRSLIFYFTSLFIVCRLSLLHFCYFLIVLLKSFSSNALTRVSFSECPRQRFLWRAALLKTDGPSRLSCNRRTLHLLLNFFCWIVIKDVQVHPGNDCDTWSLAPPLLAPLPSPREAPFPRGARRSKSFVLGSTPRSWPTRAP